MTKKRINNAYEAFDKLMEKVGYERAVAMMCATVTTAQFIHCVNGEL